MQQIRASLGKNEDSSKDPAESDERDHHKDRSWHWLRLSFLAVCLGRCFHQSVAIGTAYVNDACVIMIEVPSLLLLPVVKAV